VLRLLLLLLVKPRPTQHRQCAVKRMSHVPSLRALSLRTNPVCGDGYGVPVLPVVDVRMPLLWLRLALPIALRPPRRHQLAQVQVVLLRHLGHSHHGLCVREVCVGVWEDGATRRGKLHAREGVQACAVLGLCFKLRL
jgi:hypothetical protein